jgi:hypothetical protein
MTSRNEVSLIRMLARLSRNISLDPKSDSFYRNIR